LRLFCDRKVVISYKPIAPFRAREAWGDVGDIDALNSPKKIKQN